MRHYVRLAICILIVVFGQHSSNAAGPRPLALPSPVRAAYQVCLHYNVPVNYEDMLKAASKADSQPVDLLATVRTILASRGFNCEIQDRVSREEWLRNTRACVILHNQQPEALWTENGDYYLRDYPNAARKLSEDDLQKLWTERLLFIRDIPSVKTGDTGITAAPFASDFGLIDEGQVHESQYVLKNTSSKAIHIEGFSTSCGCAIVEGNTGRLDPGNTHFISLKFDSRGKTGYQQYYCIVKTDAGGVLLKLSGYVRSEGGYYPRTVDLGHIARDQGRQIVTVYFLGHAVDSVRPIISVSAPSSVSYSIDKGINDEWNVAEDRLILEIEPSQLNVGQFSASVKVTYHRDDKQKTVTIPVSATIVDAKRRSLLFVAKPVAIGKDMHQGFRLRGITKDRVVGLKEYPKSGLTIDIVQEDDAKDAQLVLSGKPLWSGSKEVVVAFTDTSGPSRVLYDVYITVETKEK